MARSRSDLFVVDPSEYVARRDELARELRATGDKAEAAAVRKLRRPSVAVWALNRVARDRRELVQELADAADAARVAQRRMLEGGDADDFREILARRRATQTAVAAAAANAIEDSGRVRDTYTRDIENTLTVVVASPELVTALAENGLEALPAGAGDGGDLFAGLESLPTPAARPERPGRARPRLRVVPEPEAEAEAPAPPPTPTPPPARVVKARAALERSRADLATAEAQARLADRAYAETEAALARAHADLDRAESRRDAAHRERERFREQVARSEQIVDGYES